MIPLIIAIGAANIDKQVANVHRGQDLVVYE
jgi:hypothetical protein